MKFAKIVTITLSGLFLLGILLVFIFINSIMGINNIELSKEKLISVSNNLTLYDGSSNQILSKSLDSTTVNIAEIPSHTIDAFVSIEDKEFFEHSGLNYKRIAKAMFNNLTSLSFKEGASTISQQLIKNTHLSNEKTIDRKIKEMLLTRKLEDEFSKKDILETYLNVIYFGQNSYGIKQAANNYFNKDVSELNLQESALLAGVIKAPYNYSPIHNISNCLARRNLVLNEMHKDGKITDSQLKDATNSAIELKINNITQDANQLYIESSIIEAQEILNLTEKEIRSSGLKIYTNLNTDVQANLNEIVQNTENYDINSYGNINDSLMIVLENNTSNIIGFAGKSKYDLTNFVRQPGSAIKPILVYAPALENGIIQPDTLIDDSVVDYNGYTPTNLNNTHHGHVSITKSIEDSLNVPAVKVLNYVGIDKAKKFAENAGISFNSADTGLAIALGGFTDGISLSDLANSYTPLANFGLYNKQSFINKIVDINGKTIYENISQNKKIMGDDTAYLLTDMLHSATHSGTSRKLTDFDFDVAGKTGTVAIKGTNLNTDAYSVAYTTKHTFASWIGNYSNDKEFEMEGGNNGGTNATNLIKQAIENTYKNNAPDNFVMPNSVEKIEINNKEYLENNAILLSESNCPDRYKKSILVAKRHNNFKVSSMFEITDVTDFDVMLNGTSASISFTTADYLKYKLIQVYNGKSKILKTFSNVKNKQVFTDRNLIEGAEYSYYVEISDLNENNTTISKTITVLTTSKQAQAQNLIDNVHNNNSWLFQ